jgi:hypothetical protein
MKWNRPKDLSVIAGEECMLNSTKVTHYALDFFHFHIRASKVVLVHAIKAPDGTEISLHSYITSTLDRGLMPA